jgi:hypothetical protein
MEDVFESGAPTTEWSPWRVIVEGLSDKKYQLLVIGAELPTKPINAGYPARFATTAVSCGLSWKFLIKALTRF